MTGDFSAHRMFFLEELLFCTEEQEEEIVSPVSTAIPLEDAAVSRFIQNAKDFSRPRRADFDMRVGIGSRELLVKVRCGSVQSIEDLACLRPLTSWDFSLSAAAECWQQFWEPLPAAGWHDVFALMRSGAMRIAGNLHPFMANLQLVKDLLATPRPKSRT